MRVSGQDTERGTFNQRHAVQYDQCTEERLCGVEQLAEHSDGHFEIHNSTLSEAAALGYEYGAYACKWCVCVLRAQLHWPCGGDQPLPSCATHTRLFAGAAQRTDGVGGSVWRLCERRTGDH